MQNAGRAGQLAGIKGLENFGQDPKDDTNNWQPRIGFAYDVCGNGRDVVRGGWGIYMDMAYTNSNALFAASDAIGKGFGAVLSVDNQHGIRNPDGSFYQVGQPLSNIASQNQATERAAAVRPVHRSAAADAVHAAGLARLVAPAVAEHGVHGRLRPRRRPRPQHAAAHQHAASCPNGAAPPGVPGPPARNAIGTRPAISGGESKYTALITGVKRRMTNNFDFSATYTLAEAQEPDRHGGRRAERQQPAGRDAALRRPARATARRRAPTRVTRARSRWSGMVKGFTIAPTFFYRSPLPVQTIQGVDTNLNGENNDLPAKAYQFTGIGEAPEEIGDCETWNCSRGAWRTQMNLRVSKGFGLFGSARIEAIGEVFNLLNAKNPAFTDRQQPDERRRSCSPTRTRATSSSPSSASARSGSASPSSG